MKRLFLLIFLTLTLAAGELEELQQLKKKIEDLRSQINELNLRSKTILNEIYGLELKMEMQRLEINRWQLEIRGVEAESQKILNEIKQLEARIEKNRQDLRIFVRLLYKKGRSADWSMLFLFEGFEDFFVNYFPLLRLINFKSGQINQIRQDLARLEVLRKQYEEQKQKINQLIGERDSAYRAFSASRGEKLKVLKEINRQKSQYLRLIAELKEQADYLEKFLKQSQQGERRGLPVLNLLQIKGRLDWPLHGKLIALYGRQKHQKFDAYVLNNGIVIKADREREVKAVLDGEVVFSDLFRGYGRLLIVQHSPDLYTLYGYLGEFKKFKGDRVHVGEVIALTGNSGPLSEEALYFEVRVELKSEDPLKWLKPKR